MRYDEDIYLRQMYIQMYTSTVCVHVCMYVYVCIYVYIEAGVVGGGWFFAVAGTQFVSWPWRLCAACMHVCIHTERERERDRYIDRFRTVLTIQNELYDCRNLMF